MFNRFKSYDRKARFLFLNGMISLLVLILMSAIPEKNVSSPLPEMSEAAAIMEQSIEIISSYCRRNNINMDDLIDPARTGLIGNELTELTTTIGHLDAKRTTVNPNFASLNAIAVIRHPKPKSGSDFPD